MKRVQFVLALLIACIVFSSVPPAHAQRPPRGPFRPSRRTMSPWFDLYRRDPGPLGPYYSNVRPGLQVQDTLRRHGQGIQRQKEGIQRHEQTLQRHGEALQWQQEGVRVLAERMFEVERRRLARPTGAGSMFMNYSHYYNFAIPRRGR